MVRFLLRTIVFLASAAIGLLVASLIVPGMTVRPLGFVVAVVIFAVAQAILAPFFLKMASRYASAFLGGIGLVSTLAALIQRLEELAPSYGAERRRLRVTKYRGRAFRGGYHDFVIAADGVAVFPRLVAAEHRVPFVRAPQSSGIAEPMGEDCLVLNVWTPGLRDGAKRPVMGNGGFAAWRSITSRISGWPGWSSSSSPDGPSCNSNRSTPLVAITSNTPRIRRRIDTSKVPPPRS